MDDVDHNVDDYNDDDVHDDKTQNSHNSANFEATVPRFFMVIDLNDTYRMMMMMKIQNGHN